ncbi:MAG: hypothetical protein ACK4WH_09225 [Phycisphaerales bacterium]
MSNHLPPTAPFDAPDDDLATRLDALGRALVAEEQAASTPSSPAPDSPFMLAVERSAHFRSFARLAPRFGLAAAAAIVIVAGAILSRSNPVTPTPPPISAAPDTEAVPPTLANLRRLNHDVASTDQLRLNGASRAAFSAASPPASPIATPIDARAAERIDAVTGGR